MKILILCTGNSCRSQMAEGFFRKYLTDSGDKISAESVRSAGLEPKGLNAKAVQVMREIGIDISDQTSNHVNEYLAEEFDYVITVCDNASARCPVFPGNVNRLHWPFDDPAEFVGTEEAILVEFRRIRDQIGDKVKKWVAERG